MYSVVLLAAMTGGAEAPEAIFRRGWRGNSPVVCSASYYSIPCGVVYGSACGVPVYDACGRLIGYAHYLPATVTTDAGSGGTNNGGGTSNGGGGGGATTDGDKVTAEQQKWLDEMLAAEKEEAKIAKIKENFTASDAAGRKEMYADFLELKPGTPLTEEEKTWLEEMLKKETDKDGKAERKKDFEASSHVGRKVQYELFKEKNP